jgi:hypothetical protein
VETTVGTPPAVGEDVYWDAAPLVDALPEHIRAGRRSWQDVTLAEAWHTGWRGPLLWTRE